MQHTAITPTWGADTKAHRQSLVQGREARRARGKKGKAQYRSTLSRRDLRRGRPPPCRCAAAAAAGCDLLQRYFPYFFPSMSAAAGSKAARGSSSGRWLGRGSRCRHLREPSPEALRVLRSPELWSCKTCGSTDGVWVCLECGHVGCGRRAHHPLLGGGHALHHHFAAGSHHAVVIDAANLHAVHCHACDDCLRHWELEGRTIAVLLPADAVCLAAAQRHSPPLRSSPAVEQGSSRSHLGSPTLGDSRMAPRLERGRRPTR